MEIKFNPYEDWITIVAKSKSGKSVLVSNIINKLYKDDVIVINTNWLDDKDASLYAGINNQFKPQLIKDFNAEWLDKTINSIRFKEGQAYKIYKTLVIEDVDTYIHKPSFTDSFYDFAVNGRHQKLGLILLSRRISFYLPKPFLYNSKYIFLGVRCVKEDIDYLLDSLQTDDEYRDKFLTLYKQLHLYQFLVINTDTLEMAIINNDLTEVRNGTEKEKFVADNSKEHIKDKVQTEERRDNN